MNALIPASQVPEVFLPYQQELMANVSLYTLLVVEKSRRTGFSWALGAIAALIAAAARGAGGMDVLYMGYEKDMTREFIDYVGEFGKAFQLGASECEEFEYVFNDPEHPEKSVGAFRVKFASGFEVIALPSVARALRGKQGTVIIDEAAFVDNLGAVIKAALAHLIWGGRVIVCSTHLGDQNPFNLLINEIRGKRRPGHVQRVTFDDARKEGLYRRICLTLGIEWTAEGEEAWAADILATYADNADEELHVIPNPSTGAYLPATLIDARVDKSIPVLRWKAPPGFVTWREDLRIAEVNRWCEKELKPVIDALNQADQHCLGEDFGRVIDLTVLWLLAICKDLSRPTRLVVELRDVPHEQQRQIVFYLLERIKRFRSAIFDKGGNGSYLSEVTMQKFGEERVQQLQLSEEWYRQNMPPFKVALEDAVMTLPADREIHDDLRGLKLIRGVARIPERTMNNEKLTRHGDAAIAACLAYAASKMEVEEFAYQSASPHQAPSGGGRGMRHNDEQEDLMASLQRASDNLPALRGGIW